MVEFELIARIVERDCPGCTGRAIGFILWHEASGRYAMSSADVMSELRSVAGDRYYVVAEGGRKVPLSAAACRRPLCSTCGKASLQTEASMPADGPEALPEYPATRRPAGAAQTAPRRDRRTGDRRAPGMFPLRPRFAW